MKDRFDERTAAHARNRNDTFEIIQQPSHENHEISRQELAAIREGSGNIWRAPAHVRPTTWPIQTNLS